MEAGSFASPDAAIAVATLAMDGVGEAFAEDAPLQGEVFVAVEGRTFICTPAHAAMVDDDVLLIASPHGIILRFQFVAHAASDEADDDVVGLYHKRVVLQADAVAWSCLSGYGDVSILYFKRLLQLDDARYVEDDDTWPRHGQAVSERSGTTIIQIGDVIDGTATSARRGVACKTFGAREGWGRGGRFVWSICRVIVGDGDRRYRFFGRACRCLTGTCQTQQEQPCLEKQIFHDFRWMFFFS